MNCPSVHRSEEVQLKQTRKKHFFFLCLLFNKEVASRNHPSKTSCCPGFVGNGTCNLLWLKLLAVISLSDDLTYDTHWHMGDSALPGRRPWGVDSGWKSSGLSACDRPSHFDTAAPPSGWDLYERHSEQGRFIKQPSGTSRQLKSPHAMVHLSRNDILKKWGFTCNHLQR